MLKNVLKGPENSSMWKLNKGKIIILLSILVGIEIGGYKKYIKEKSKAKETMGHIPYGIYEAAIKRPCDVLISGIALILFSPMIAVIALLVKIKMGSPILFTQKRPGLNGKIFTIYKFRTMNDRRDTDGGLFSDEERLTPFGKLLRRTSLDELPELYNILIGDMSVVGPRPLLVDYMPRYNEYQKHRHDVKPGLTGLAQVNGRNKLSWGTRFEDDLKYVERITFLGDIHIILKTVVTVFKKDGISSGTSATMEPFMGN